MNSNIDNLIVPHIDNLGEMSTDGIINALEDNGVRRTIDYIDYKEFPYHPLTTFSMAYSKDILCKVQLSARHKRPSQHSGP